MEMVVSDWREKERGVFDFKFGRQVRRCLNIYTEVVILLNWIAFITICLPSLWSSKCWSQPENTRNFIILNFHLETIDLVHFKIIMWKVST